MVDLRSSVLENFLDSEKNRNVIYSLIDTHCHLEMDEFEDDRDSVIKRANDAGVSIIITISSDIESNLKAVDLSDRYDCVYSTIGLHPHDAKDFSEEFLSEVIKLSEKKKVVAIGEIGLDYHYNNSPREKQKEVFERQLLIAKELNLPVVIHSREAKQDTLEILKLSGVNRGVFHCFSGDYEMAKKILSMGFMISIAGPVTFKKASRLKEIAKLIPDENLLIETDSPYLAPEPFRGKRNEPSLLIHTAKVIAELRGISLEDIARITTLNAKKLFKIGEIEKEGVIAYKIRDSLYLNITNKCTNRCIFCIRFHTDYVKGHNLRLLKEPDSKALKKAIGDPKNYKEIVFCGYGEPLIRLNVVKDVARWIKQNGGVVRINTNGHGNLIHKRNILPELKDIVDKLSISLDAHDEETYNRICKPVFRNAFNAVIDFIKESKRYINEVTVTVVNFEGVDIEKCRKLAQDLGVKFRVREFNIVG